MDAFATVEDLLAGWPGKELSQGDSAVAATLLTRATAQLSAMLAARGVAVDPDDEVQAENLKAVTCNMVRRAMSSVSDGVASMSQTVGSTSASVSWSNPDGAFYLTKQDKLALGLAGGSRYRSVRAATFADSEV